MRSPTRTSSPRRKRQGKVVVGELVRSDGNRTRYQIYVNEDVEYGKVKLFFQRLYAILGYERAYTRNQLKEAVQRAGRGDFEIKYNSVVRVTGSERRRLF